MKYSHYMYSRPLSEAPAAELDPAAAEHWDQAVLSAIHCRSRAETIVEFLWPTFMKECVFWGHSVRLVRGKTFTRR